MKGLSGLTARSLAIMAAAWFVLAGCLWADGHSDWPVFAPLGGGFSVRMPGTPTDEGNPKTGRHSYNLYTGDERSFVAYSVTYLDMPDGREMPQLEQRRDTLLGLYFKSRLIKSARVQVAGIDALALVFDSTPAESAPWLRAKYLLFAVGRRVFQLGYSELPSRFTEARADEYLSTFARTNR